MRQLVDAFRELFAAGSRADSEIATTARIALDETDWGAELQPQLPQCPVAVPRDLDSACANSGSRDGVTHKLAQALLEASKRLHWHTRKPEPNEDPEITAFTRNYAVTTIVGDGGLLPSSRIIAGFSLQGPETFYPPHAHVAVETYWIIGGNGHWKVDSEPWFAVQPGHTVYHRSGAHHAMRTTGQSLLSVWLWTSHLKSNVVFVPAKSGS